MKINITAGILKKMEVDENDLFDLDCHIAVILANLLTAFKQSERMGFPSSVKEKYEANSDEEYQEIWEEILDDMIWSFSNYNNSSPDNEDRIQEGINLFAEFFTNLWD